MRKLLFFLPLLLNAQDPIAEDRGAAGLHRAQLSAKTSIRAMHIAAHPDDEDGPAITLLARKHGVDMSMLILNRGESGANLVTSDFFDALGALRTVEYGYSKNVGETFRQWNREEVLADMVRIIRSEKPHILISRWSGTPQDGHGNHEASGILAQEAFAASADPKRFPDAGPPWQPLKLYVGTRNPFDGYTIKLSTGEFDPVLGRTYAQIAREGLRFPRSQATGGAVSRLGPQFSYYRLTQSKVGLVDKEESLLERIPDGPNPRPFPAPGPHVEARVDPSNPLAGPFAAFRPAETFSVAVPGQTFKATVKLHGAEATKIELVASPAYQITENEPGRFTIKVPDSPAYTAAYWTRDSIREPKYKLSNNFAQPLPDPPIRVRAIDVEVRSGLRIGYLMGSGDDVPEALQQLGVSYDLISPTADFSKYTTILLGIRAYAARPDLPANNARLLEFARNGGTVIVQYNTPEFDKNFGPFPYTMGRNPEEVSEEDSPVKILVPNAPVFAAPNAITLNDLDGWVEQRGSKFFTTWAPEYRPLIETNDTGQKPQQGIWLEATVGKGKWIYCALAWYRQLPYAVPGATRLFANLISQ